MIARQECCHEVLATGPVAGIFCCKSCNVVSVQLGSTTVRLDPAACESLWATLGEALAVLQTRLESTGAMGIPSRATLSRGSA